jgi:hypothetical protein
MARINGIVGLLVGVFGAIAIIGVLAKVAKLPNWEPIMMVGFLGEAAAFLIMGIIALIGSRQQARYAEEIGVAGPAEGEVGFAGYGSPEYAEELHAAIKEQVKTEVSRIMGTLGEDLEAVSARFGQDSANFSSEFRAVLMEQVAPQIATDLGQLTHQMSQAMGALGEDVQRVTDEMRGMSSEMEQARGAVGTMREQLLASANGNLPEDAAKLGNGMRSLSDEMAAAGNAAETIRNEMEQMVNRFRSFNAGASVANGQATHAQKV